MPRATVTFRRLVLNSHQFGSKDEHMISKVIFDIEIEGKLSKGLEVELKQTVGSDFATDPIEVSAPSNYRGLMNHQELSEAVERLYRDLIGPTGRVVQVPKSAREISVRNFLVKTDRVVTFEVAPGGGPW